MPTTAGDDTATAQPEHDDRPPYRLVDRLYQGWVIQSGGPADQPPVYSGYDPAAPWQQRQLGPATLEQITAELSPIRTVEPRTTADEDRLEAAFDRAEHRAVGTLCFALAALWLETAREYAPELALWTPGGLDLPETPAMAGPGIEPPAPQPPAASVRAQRRRSAEAHALRSLTAGRPGSWESALIRQLVFTGLMIPHRTGDEIELEALGEIVLVLRRWTRDQHHYVEVAENLASVTSSYADRVHGPHGWHRMTGDYLRAADHDADDSAADVRRLLWSLSEHVER